MIVRIVKMSFSEVHIDEFLDNFNLKKEQIRHFEGCQFLELYRDINHPNIFFTYSHWDTEADLENYKQSALFKTVWAKTKPLFNAKPEAWSVEKVVSLE